MTTERQHPKFLVRGLGLAGAVFGLGACTFFLACAGFIVFLEVPITLAFGWVRFLERAVPKLNPDPWSVASAIVCLAGVTVGSHLFLRWVIGAGRQPAGGAPVPGWSWKRSVQLVTLLVVLFGAGTAATGFVQQTGWLFRSKEQLVDFNTPDEYASRDNLKRFGAALDTDPSRQGNFPRSRFDATGRPMHSWQTAALGFLGDRERETASQIDATKPWADPANAAPLSEPIHSFQNLAFNADKVNGLGVSHYAGNVTVVLGDPKRPDSFPAGAANTIFAGEVSSNFRAWGDPLNVRDPRSGARGHPNGFGGAYGKPAQFLMLDGSVRTFDPAALAAAAEGANP